MEKIDGKLIKESRWKLGISQGELSAAIGIDRSTISRLEAKGIPTFWGNMCLLADYLGLSLDSLRLNSAQKNNDRREFSEDEIHLIDTWRALNDSDRDKLKAIIEMFQIK